MIEQNNLIREIQFLYRQFFRCAAPQKLIEQYLLIHAELPDLKLASKRELQTVRIIIDKELDALGIEPWLRSTSQRHLLTRKILLTAYLAECDPTSLEFRQGTRGRIQSFTLLCRSSLLAAMHLLRGRFQKAIYGLV